jgi:hypothetical protein
VSLRTPCDACHQMFFVMLYVYARLRKKKKRNMEPVRLQPPTCLPLLLLERTRVNTVFLHRGDTSIEREVRVKIRKFRLIATIVLSLFFFFSLDSYALYVYARIVRLQPLPASICFLRENERMYVLSTI